MRRLAAVLTIFTVAALSAPAALVAQTDRDRQAKQLLDEVADRLKTRRLKQQAESKRLTDMAVGIYAEQKYFEARELLKRALEADPANAVAQKYFKLATANLEEDRDPRLEFVRQRELSRFEEARERTALEMKLQEAERLARQRDFRKAENLLRQVQQQVSWSFYRERLKDLSDQAAESHKRLVAAETPSADVTLPRPSAAPDDGLDRAASADRLIDSAQRFYREGDLDRAEAYAEVAMKLDRDNERAQRFAEYLKTGRSLRTQSMILPAHDLRTTASGADIVRKRDHKVLITPVKADFKRVPLASALEYIETYCDVDIVVHARDLARVGTNLKTPVSLAVDGERLQTVMRMIGEQVNLEAGFENGVITLKAPHDDDRLEERVYDVSDLLARPIPDRRDDELLNALPAIPLSGAVLDPVGFPNVYVSGTAQHVLHNDAIGYGGYGAFNAGVPGYGVFWGPGSAFTGWGAVSYSGYPYQVYPSHGLPWYGGNLGWYGSVPTAPGPYYPWPDRSYSYGGGYGGTYYGSRYGGFSGLHHPGAPGFGFTPYAGSNETVGPLWGGPSGYDLRSGWSGPGGSAHGRAWEGFGMTPYEGRPKIYFDLDEQAADSRQPRRGRAVRRDPYATGLTEQELLELVREALEKGGYKVDER